MADKDIRLLQEQSDGSFLEKDVTPAANQVLGFDGSKDPISLASGTRQGSDGTYDIEPTDDGATGGNARGENSVDLCTKRSNAAYVCAGINSGALAGENVGGTGTHTAYLGGLNNHSNSGHYCSISGHNNQGNFGSHSVIGGKVADASTKIATSGTSAEADDNLITSNSHNLTLNQPVRFTTLTGGTGLNLATTYYARTISANTFAVAAAPGGAEVDITVDYTVANYIGNAVNYGNFNIIVGEDCEGNSGSWCNISGDQNHDNSGSYCSISGSGNVNNSGNHCSISGSGNVNNSGSHCSISGFGNSYNSGYYCSISGYSSSSNSGGHCSISGKYNSSNSGSYCSISGADNGSNSGGGCSISGRINNSNSGYYCSISGRGNHNNSASYCVIGGKDNDYIHADAAYSLICGELNSKTGTDASEGSHCIIGGKNNYNNSGDYCSISGSGNHSNSGGYCLISGQGNSNNSGYICSISGYFNSGNTGGHCSISGKYNSSNSGSYCSISGADNGSNSGGGCSISGRINNSNSGYYCSISGRVNHSNSGYCCLISGYYAPNNALNYARVHGGNTNARIIDLVAQINSVSTTATELLLGGTVGPGGTRIIIPDQSAWNVDVRFVAKTETGANASIQNFTGVIVRDGTSTLYAAGTSDAAITTIGTTNVTAFTVDKDDTNEALKLTVACSSGTVRCVARIHLTQVDY